MELLQDQVSVLNEKVDALQHMIERLSQHVTEILAELKVLGAERTHTHRENTRTGHYSHSGHFTLDDDVEHHKDILMDTGYGESDLQAGDRALSPEVQIQRLTAQLTAAYNRIAALEEQLLSHRIHS